MLDAKRPKLIVLLIRIFRLVYVHGDKQYTNRKSQFTRPFNTVPAARAQIPGWRRVGSFTLGSQRTRARGLSEQVVSKTKKKTKTICDSLTFRSSSFCSSFFLFAVRLQLHIRTEKKKYFQKSKKDKPRLVIYGKKKRSRTRLLLHPPPTSFPRNPDSSVRIHEAYDEA